VIIDDFYRDAILPQIPIAALRGDIAIYPAGRSFGARRVDARSAKCRQSAQHYFAQQ
jgi:hypothetical protein